LPRGRDPLGNSNHKLLSRSKSWLLPTIPRLYPASTTFPTPPWPTRSEAELTALKDEFKSRGLAEVAGEVFAVTATEQISGRLDSNAVKAFLGDAYVKFEKAIVSTVIRVKASERLALAA
jgi:hypothetical protein